MSAAGDRLQDIARTTALCATTRLLLDHTGRYLDNGTGSHWGRAPASPKRLVTDAVENSYDLVVELLPRRDRPGTR